MFKKLFKRLSGKKSPEPPYHRKKELFIVDTPPTFPEETMIETLSSDRFTKDPQRKRRVINEIDVLVNGEKISSYRITDEGISVGRDPSRVGIIIAEPIISKLHCSFFREGENLKVIDHNSTNGVYYDGIKIRDKVLRDGSVISLGKKGTVKLVVHNIREDI